MTVGALDPIFSRTKYQDTIDFINLCITLGSIASASGTVTTALANLATERDKH
jgi:hypothetical protein